MTTDLICECGHAASIHIGRSGVAETCAAHACDCADFEAAVAVSSSDRARAAGFLHRLGTWRSDRTPAQRDADIAELAELFAQARAEGGAA